MRVNGDWQNIYVCYATSST